MRRHKFIVGNPCQPCEYHIERAVKIFCWFDLVFQAIFITPAILQLKTNLCKENGGCLQPEEKEVQPPHKSDDGDAECYEDLMGMAVLYSTLDVVNLSVGIFMDIFLFICCTQQKSLKLKLAGAWLFFILSIARQALHIYCFSLHLQRCSSTTYLYEIITRLLCQYLLYGIWIVVEYIGWLHKGRKFVPQHGQLTAPGEQLEGTYTFDSIISEKLSSRLIVVERHELNEARLSRIKASIRNSRKKAPSTKPSQHSQAVGSEKTLDHDQWTVFVRK